MSSSSSSRVAVGVIVAVVRHCWECLGRAVDYQLLVQLVVVASAIVVVVDVVAATLADVVVAAMFHSFGSGGEQEQEQDMDDELVHMEAEVEIEDAARYYY